MLVVLGGFLGSGRKHLAQQIARKYGLYYMNIDSFKLRAQYIDIHGAFADRILEPRSDRERTSLFKKVVGSFPLYSKMHPDMILESSFHRTVPRDYFFRKASMYFDKVRFIWIDSDTELVYKRLYTMQSKGVISSVESANRIRTRAQEQFQEFEIEPIRFQSTGNKSDIEQLWDTITTGARPK